jgi:hypothetical protein
LILKGITPENEVNLTRFGKDFLLFSAICRVAIAISGLQSQFAGLRSQFQDCNHKWDLVAQICWIAAKIPEF